MTPAQPKEIENINVKKNIKKYKYLKKLLTERMSKIPLKNSCLVTMSKHIISSLSPPQAKS